MSLLNTKPRYFPTAVATQSGWANPVTGELLVSIGNLKHKLELEDVQKLIYKIPTSLVVVPESVVVEVVIPAIVVIKEPKKEIVMNESVPEVKTRKPYAPRKPKVIGEVTESNVPAGQQLIGEVVEYKLDTPIIGE